jgi:hypothetical protein
MMMKRLGVEVAVATEAEHPGRARVGSRVSLDELARRKGVRPVESIEDMGQDGVFSSDEEVDAFLVHVYTSRHADLAERCTTSCLTPTSRPEASNVRRLAGSPGD